MYTSLTRKFTLFYWFTFFIVVIPIYIFGSFYIKDILKSTEDEKIHIMLNTLKPTIALNLSFEQENEVVDILKTLLEEKNILSVTLDSELMKKKLVSKRVCNAKTHSYKTVIQDPFKIKKIATIQVVHSYEYLNVLHNKINDILFYIFLFAVFMFFLFYYSMKKELNALKIIANTFALYSSKKELVPIKINSKTTEIQTIASTSNEMIKNISSYLQRLESFNTSLEEQVQEKVDKLREQEKMLVHQSRQAAMGEMLESIAHQWRQPLNIIGLSCANLEMEHDLGVVNEKNFKEKMQIIASNIEYMSSTIDDFRDFLNPDRELVHFNPKESIEAVYNVLSAQLEHNNIQFTLTQKDQTQLFGIENEFKQVIFVLINNSKDAIKSLQDNFENFVGKIDVEISLDKEDVKISFCDNGGGIKDEIFNSIFTPYFTTKFSSSGTGIGLYMAKNIIESRMQGEITVHNIQAGCCFTITQNKNIHELKEETP